MLAQEDMIPIFSDKIWLDNLYLRSHCRGVPPGSLRLEKFITLAAMPPLNGTRANTGARYLTRMTLQGDNQGPTVGVFADEKVYVEGVALLTTLHPQLLPEPARLHPECACSLLLSWPAPRYTEGMTVACVASSLPVASAHVVPLSHCEPCPASSFA